MSKLPPRITPLPRRRRIPTPSITPAFAASLARVLTARATDPDWAARSLAALLPSPLPDARLADAVFSLADPDLGLALLSWSRSHHRHAGPTPLAHSALLRLVARAGRLDAADAALRSASLAGAVPTRASLGALAAAYADAGVDGKAAEVCARARDLHGALPPAAHCNRLLRLLVERRRWVDAQKLYDEMLAEEGGADNYSTCVMIRGLCMEGRVEEGRKLIEARWGEGCVPHVVFYNVLIDGYCRRGDIGRGLLLLGDMDTKGFLPTMVTYGVIINWLGRKGDLAKIGSLLGEMRVRGLSPNVQIYNTVIDALCKCRSASQAMAVLKQMLATWCDPDIVTFNTLISTFCQEGNVQEALRLLREAVRRELEPNQLSYTPLIHGFCVRGEVMVASDLLVEMMRRGHTPDVVTFGALIHGLVVAGQVSEALIVREKMAERQVMPDVNIYNVLISGLCKKRMLSAAKNLLSEMLEQNIQPDKFVYTTLIDGFIRSENLDDARKIFDFMEDKGVCLDVVGYNAMIKGYCKFGMMNEAILCMNGMRKVRHNMLGKALNLKDEMAKKGYTPDPVTFLSLLYGFCSVGEPTNWRGILPNEFRQDEFETIVSPPFILSVTESTCSGTPAAASSFLTSITNSSTTLATMDFICTYAISFPRHILGPAWNTVYRNGLSGRNAPSSESHRSGLYSAQSSPHMAASRPMA
ncbi:hypothetical protein U9M48_005353 [Paspalum notatum var. saurae]|uniref:Pentatricopeptide repeat-containing protein n=1 Tax=Paspalum notatum var. saurae TaxID=547442 RepID=A0AAQ3PS17_PASNO